MTAILFLSDLHINSTVALSLPIVKKDDGREEHYSRPQKFIYNCWLKTLERAEEISKGEDLITVFVGDIADMRMKHGGFQVITNNPTYIKNHVVELIEPVCNLSQQVYFMRGTPEHVGKSAYLEEDIAGDFENTIENKEANSKSWYYLKLKVDGVKMDIAHAMSHMSVIPWNKPNAVKDLASRVMFDYVNHRLTPPDLVIRGHMHRGSDSYDNFITRAITLRCFTFADEFVYGFVPSHISEIGATIIHTRRGGKYDVEKLEFEIPEEKYQCPKLYPAQKF